MKGIKVLKYPLAALYIGVIFSIIAWGIPLFNEGDHPLARLGKSWQKHVSSVPFRYLGLWQGWAMFAPNPSKLNLGIEIILEHQDRQIKIISMPRLSQMPKWEAYKRERHRKFLGNLRKDSQKATWPRAAQYFRGLHDDPQNPIVRIDLIRKWSSVKIPKDPKASLDRPQHTYLDKSYMFYSWEKQ